MSSFDELVCFFDVGDFEIFGVPFEFLIGEVCREAAEEYGFGERSGVVEVGAGFVVTLASVDELRPVVVAFDFRIIEIDILCFGE